VAATKVKVDVTHPDPLQEAIAFLRKTKLALDVWLVGGYVRDQLAGRRTNDLDVIVSDGAIRLARALADALSGHFFVLDDERQVGRVIVERNGRTAAKVDVARLRAPQLRDDLRLRDFTVTRLP
jgi:tRNA nucleotidyltransferase/poly(A) polymerase